MALRQLIPVFEPALAAPGEQPLVLQRARKPVEVGFRGGADLREVVAAIMAKRNVVVDAAPGAGKTTVLPEELAKASGGLVLHVLPYDLMAGAQQSYLASVLPESTAPVLALSPAEPYPRRGWVFTSAACVVAKWLASGVVSLPDCYLLHDESHESGVYSALLRRFGPVLDNVRCYAQMSATLGLGVARNMEAAGSVTDRTYNPDEFLDPWAVAQRGAPWSVDALDDHVLLFEDDKQRATNLVAAYNQCGIKAFRLHSGMSVKSLLGVMAQVRAERVSVCALVADSTFRSSYTMPVSTILDNGKVKFLAVVDGKPVYRERPIFEVERVQTRARGGRVKGQRTEYWRPSGSLQNKVCDLEPCELEAYALILRVLGYAVPEEASSAVMGSGRFPRDLCGALRSGLPLAALPSGALVDEVVFRGPRGRVSPYLRDQGVRACSDDDEFVAPRSHRRMRCESDGAMRVSRPNTSTQPQTTSEVSKGSVLVDEGRGALRSMLDTTLAESTIEVGEYYYAVGLSSNETRNVAFPDGWDSVLRVVARDKSATAHLRWSCQDRSVAVSSMVSCLNVTTVEMRALSSALGLARGELAGREPTAVRRWVKSSAERLSELSALAGTCAELLLRFGEDFCDYRCVEAGFPQEEARIRQVYVDSFQTLPRLGVGPPPEQLDSVRHWTGSAVEGFSYHGNRGAVADAVMPLKAKGARPVPPLLAYLGGGTLRTGVRRLSHSSSGSGGTGDAHMTKPKRRPYYAT